eukprot:TRINITY_DN4129_c0_g1_i3.p1 TRINITY_DN4129_c0_g1~~TRINITY_DN4129_c0_g1_i3.p1  ORF type:complete len:198 (-),score=54.54 TRINITY_DN4129_c0_g1_i3:31-624(-)
MFATRNEYDRGPSTFSPEGRLLQVEYAMQAVKNGSSSVGLRVNEGVVLAVERRVTSILVEPKSIEKLFEIDSHIGCAVSGLVNDAKNLIDHARVESQNHTFVYNEPISVHALTQCVSDLALQFGETEYGEKKKAMARPFGVALLIAGVDRDGPALYHADPSGTMIRYDAKGIGSGQEAIEDILKEQYRRVPTHQFPL